MDVDKRVQASERCRDGECAVCGRRHIHRDDCATLKRRMAQQSGEPPLPYSGGAPA